MVTLKDSKNKELFDMLSNKNNEYSIFYKSVSIEDIFCCVCDYNDNLEILSLTNNLNNNFINNISLEHILDKHEYNYLQSLINRALKNNKKSFYTELEILDNNKNPIPYLCYGNFINDNKKNNIIELSFLSIQNLKNNEQLITKYRSVIESKHFVFLEGEIKDNNTLHISFLSDNISFYGFKHDDIITKNININNIIFKNDINLLLSNIKKNINDSKSFTQIFRIIDPQKNKRWIIAKGFVDKLKTPSKLFLFFNCIDSHFKYIEQFSNKQKQLSENLKKSNLITDILKLLQVTHDYEKSIRIILRKLTEYAKLSKTILYLPDSSLSEQNIVVYSYNKSNNNFKISNTSMNQLNSNYPRITKALNTYGTAYCDKFGASEGCYDEFKNYGMKCCLIYTIYLQNGQNAFLCCIDKNPERSWDNNLITVISDISQVITGMIHSFLISNQLSNTKNTLTKVLDNIDAYVLVSELSTDKIIYSNKKFNDTFGYDSAGKHFWDVVQIEKAQCVSKHKVKCVTDTYTDNNSLMPRYYEIYCPVSDQWLDVTEVNIRWHTGKMVKLTTMNDITQKVNYEKLIENQAFTDHLTNLPNRRMLEHDFPIVLAEAEKHDSFGYILFLDLDNFKNVNDGLGHPFGDALLIQISQFLLSMKYISNSCYRFGGDEFVILVGYKNADKIDDIIDTLFNKFQQKWKIINTEYYCTASIGVAKFPYDGYTLFDLMKKVDMAMYSSKKLGKNRLTYYKSKIGSESIRNIELERYFRESIDNNYAGFEVHYQPIINAKTLQIEGAEALLRWSSENIGHISPSEFIPLTESIGLIVPLGEYVLTEATKKCKEIISMGFPNFKMFINLSVLQLIESNIVERIKSIIEKANVSFNNIGLEITESLAINDINKMKKVLEKLSNLGIKISLDDFGTGYSSLNYIKQLPLNTIKIDKSFIDDLDKNNGTDLFVSAIVNIAHGLHMKVCAEGVETKSQYDKLLNLKADVIQGYYFGKPMPSDDFTKLFKENKNTIALEVNK